MNELGLGSIRPYKNLTRVAEIGGSIPLCSTLKIKLISVK
jgi:hypothetical protein